MKNYDKSLLIIFALNVIGALLLGHWDSFFGWSCATLVQIKNMNII